MHRSRSPLSGDEGSHDDMAEIDDGPDNDGDGDNPSRSGGLQSNGSGGSSGQSIQIGGGNDSNSMKRKKKTRTVFSRTQVFQLESTFDMKRYLSSSERAALATSLRLTETQVRIVKYFHFISTLNNYFLFDRKIHSKPLFFEIFYFYLRKITFV